MNLLCYLAYFDRVDAFWQIGKLYALFIAINSDGTNNSSDEVVDVYNLTHSTRNDYCIAVLLNLYLLVVYLAQFDAGRNL